MSRKCRSPSERGSESCRGFPTDLGTLSQQGTGSHPQQRPFPGPGGTFWLTAQILLGRTSIDAGSKSLRAGQAAVSKYTPPFHGGLTRAVVYARQAHASQILPLCQGKINQGTWEGRTALAEWHPPGRVPRTLPFGAGRATVAVNTDMEMTWPWDFIPPQACASSRGTG